MIANDMKYKFLVGLDSMFEFTAPGYDDRQVSAILNQAQDEVFQEKYNPRANKFGVGFEYNEKRRRDLAELIRTITLDATTTTGSISYTGNFTTGSNVVSNVSSMEGLAEGISLEDSATNNPYSLLPTIFMLAFKT